MEFLTIGDFNFLIFIIPGFLTVWTFRYFIRSKKRGDFELLGLSFVWGLIILIFVEFLLKKSYKIEHLLSNPYGAAIVLSIFGIIFGWCGSHISQWSWFKKLIQRVSSKLDDSQKSKN